MTTKHFKAIAATLLAHRADRALVEELANTLANINPRFDRGRFITAATGHPSLNEDAVQRAANIVDGADWSRVDGGSLGEQIAHRLNRAGLITGGARAEVAP